MSAYTATKQVVHWVMHLPGRHCCCEFRTYVHIIIAGICVYLESHFRRWDCILLMLSSRAMLRPSLSTTFLRWYAVLPVSLQLISGGGLKDLLPLLLKSSCARWNSFLLHLLNSHLQIPSSQLIGLYPAYLLGFSSVSFRRKDHEINFFLGSFFDFSLLKLQMRKLPPLEVSTSGVEMALGFIALERKIRKSNLHQSLLLYDFRLLAEFQVDQGFCYWGSSTGALVSGKWWKSV